jgi:hypothetical protein
VNVDDRGLHKSGFTRVGRWIAGDASSASRRASPAYGSSLGSCTATCVRGIALPVLSSAVFGAHSFTLLFLVRESERTCRAKMVNPGSRDEPNNNTFTSSGPCGVLGCTVNRADARSGMETI